MDDKTKAVLEAVRGDYLGALSDLRALDTVTGPDDHAAYMERKVRRNILETRLRQIDDVLHPF